MLKDSQTKPRHKKMLFHFDYFSSLFSFTIDRWSTISTQYIMLILNFKGFNTPHVPIIIEHQILKSDFQIEEN